MSIEARLQKRSIILVILFITVTGIATVQSLGSPLTGWVLLAHLVAIMTSFFRPFYGLLLYLTLIFFVPQGLSLEIALLRVMLRMASILLLVFLTHKIFRKENIYIFSNRQQIMMIALLGLVPLSQFSNLRLGASWEAFNMFLTVFMLFFFIVNLTDDMSKLRKVSWVLITWTTCLAINGIIQYRRGYDLFGITPTYDGRIRWLVWFGDPNDLALAFNSIIPFVIMFFFEKRAGVLRKIVLMVIMGILLYGMYCTNSRGGILALLAMTAYFSYRKFGRARGMTVIAVCLVLGIIFRPSRMGEMALRDGSAMGRIYAWRAGLSMFMSRPVFGIGYNNFLIFHNLAAHSSFIQVISELGFVGYFTWLALLYTSFFGLRKAEMVTTNITIRDYAFTLQLSIVGFLGSAFFLSQAFSPILYIILALSAIILNNREVPIKWPQFLSKREIRNIAVLAAATILFYFVLVAVY